MKLLRPLSYERRLEVQEQLNIASSPGFDFFLLVVLSSCIATFGLITDSAAVIIGAMLVAPLMSPILGLSLASVAGQQHMFRRATVALFEGALMAVVLSAVITWLARMLPFDVLSDLPHEVFIRTRPTPFDLGIALAGGAAAAYALAQRHLSAALPGVAIATALMPPLCTVGIGISLANTSIVLGALLLFLTNLFTISFSGITVFVLLGFRPRRNNVIFGGLPQGFYVSTILVLVVAIPLIFLSLRFVQEGRMTKNVMAAVSEEVDELPDAQVIDVQMDNQPDAMNLTLTIRTSRQIRYSEVVHLQSAIAERLQFPVALQVIDIPTIKLDPLVPPTYTPTPTSGPSLTPTVTSTEVPTRTPTPFHTSTPTQTPTPTYTATPTFTPTPILAYIYNFSGVNVLLREVPEGRGIGILSSGTPVQIMYRKEVVNEEIWLEVRDLFGRIGWVREIFIRIP
ncbi:MAG: DUF389 domain-containing protein [Chloroflexi bacterium]|nr:MAG: DUF389 domain-containing protein [Chloroflexota bacterium]